MSQIHSTRKLFPERSTTIAKATNDFQCIHEAFEAQAALRPNQVALVCEDQEVTFKELNEQSNQLAQLLRSQGCQKGHLIGVCTYRSVEMVISLLASLKIGTAYIPIDPDYPADRIEIMLTDAEPEFILTHNGLQNKLSTDSGSIINISNTQAYHHLEKHNLNVKIDAEDPAYIIYTSGSTGRPKGAVLPHLAIANHMEWLIDEFKMTPDDTVLQKTPFSFDASVWEFYATLLSGGRLVMARPGGHMDTPYLIETIKRHDISILQLVPTLLNMLLEEDNFQECTSLKKVFCGGEALPPKEVSKFHKTFDRAEIINLYGPTETCIDATFHRCIRDTEYQSVPIGRGINNTELLVLDEQGNIVINGGMGELHIGGHGLALGYLFREELSRKKFIEHPFKPGYTVYKTGDLVRKTNQGELEFLGRVDHQVKFKGYRIELGEIENAILKNDKVALCAVVVQESASSDKFLAAFLSESPGMHAASSELESALRNSLSKQLPEYMVPQVFVVLDEMPMSPNGKIDRKRLPEAKIELSQDDSHYEPPKDDEERIIEGILAELVGREKLSRNQDFFRSGGESLKAMRAVARIRNHFKADYNIGQFFENPTVAAVRESLRHAQRASEEHIELVEPKKCYELAPMQLTFFMLESFGRGVEFNGKSAYTFSGISNIDLLKKSLNILLERHESLRTNFRMTDEGPRQFISEKVEAHIEEHDLRSAAEVNNQTSELLKAAGAYRFDIAKDLLVRFTIIRQTDDQLVLGITTNHIVGDGWSMSVLLKDLLKIMAYLHDGEDRPTANKIQFKDYSAWIKAKHADEAEIEKLRSYWKVKCSGELPKLDLNKSITRPLMKTSSGASLIYTIPAVTVERLKKLSNNKGITLFMTLNAIIKTLIHQYAVEEDVVVGSPVAGRFHKDLEDQIGCFLNLLPLRDQVTSDMSFDDLVVKVKKTTLDAYKNQMYPILNLVEDLKIEVDFSRSFGYDVLFTFHNNEVVFDIDRDLIKRLNGLQIESHPFPSAVNRYDLSFDIMVSSDGALEVDMEYNTDLLNANQVLRIGKDMEVLSERVIANSALKLSELLEGIDLL